MLLGRELVVVGDDGVGEDGLPWVIGVRVGLSVGDDGDEELEFDAEG